MQLAVSALVFGSAWILLLLRVDPVPTWFYVFAWYPTLGLLDGLATKLDGGPSLGAQPRLAVSLFAWSPVIWLAFEAVNFRLENWYYVFLPANPVERWAGIVLSFATVMPAVVLAERVLAAARVFHGGTRRPLLVRSAHLRAAPAVALAALALALAWPSVFFPLVWGVGLFLCEPVVYRRLPEMSLARDLERGDWGRVGRLLLGGLGIGLLWEFYNHWAEGGWIYTVPGLERLRLFEMPPLGFLGFPIFALSAWAMYGALCAAGVARPVEGPGRAHRRRAVPAGLAAAGFAAAVLWGMERLTISSTVPRLTDLPGLAPTDGGALRAAGVRTVRDLATQDPERLAQQVPLDPIRAGSAVEAARLATLHGLGGPYTEALSRLGVRTRCQLVGWDADTLANRVRRAGRRRPTAAEVRVWCRAAARECGTGAAASPD